MGDFNVKRVDKLRDFDKNNGDKKGKIKDLNCFSVFNLGDWIAIRGKMLKSKRFAW